MKLFYKYILLLLSIFLCSCGGSSESLSLDDSSNIAQPGVTSSLTDNSGKTIVRFGESEMVVEVADDSGGNVADVEVYHTFLADGVFLWTQSDSYALSTSYVPFVSAKGAISAFRRLPNYKKIPLSALIFEFIGVTEYITDPPEVREIWSSEYIREECIYFDINDIAPFVPIAKLAKYTSGYIKVKKSPSASRGGISKSFGFTGRKATLDIITDTVTLVSSQIVDILDNNFIRSWCYFESGNDSLPFITMEFEERSQSPITTASCGTVLSKPRFTIDDQEVLDSSSIRYELAFENPSDFPSNLFEKAPDLPQCGQNNTNSSRTWVTIQDSGGNRIYGFCSLESVSSLDKIWFVGNGQYPTEVQVELNDRLCDLQSLSDVILVP